jgi:hypothetical protein
VRSSAAKALSFVALATLATASTSSGEDEFPLVGTYSENQPCKANGSDASAVRVKITSSEIDSALGLSTILQNKREGNTFAVHVDCKGPGGSQMLAHEIYATAGIARCLRLNTASKPSSTSCLRTQ